MVHGALASEILCGRPPTIWANTGYRAWDKEVRHQYTMRFVIHEEQYAFPEGQTPAPIFIGAERTFDIHSAGAFRQKDAEIIESKSGAVNNADTVIPLAKLHPFTGRVTAFSDGHLLNGGSAELLYADDGTKSGRS